MFSMLVLKTTAFYSFKEVYIIPPLWCCCGGVEITDSPFQIDLEVSFKLLTMVRFSLAVLSWLRSLLLY